MVDTVEVDAPLYLAEGQNIFEQPPFREILEYIQRTRGISHDKLRDALTRFSRDESLPRRGPMKDLEGLLSALLDPYPNWRGYLKAQGHSFRPSGEPHHNLKYNPICPPDSYAYWITRNKVLADRLVLAGIEEIFPKDFVSGIPPTKQIQPVKNHIRMLIAANIIPEPR